MDVEFICSRLNTLNILRSCFSSLFIYCALFREVMFISISDFSVFVKAVTDKFKTTWNEITAAQPEGLPRRTVVQRGSPES